MKGGVDSSCLFFSSPGQLLSIGKPNKMDGTVLESGFIAMIGLKCLGISGISEQELEQNQKW